MRVLHHPCKTDLTGIVGSFVIKLILYLHRSDFNNQELSESVATPAKRIRIRAVNPKVVDLDDDDNPSKDRNEVGDCDRCLVRANHYDVTRRRNQKLEDTKRWITTTSVCHRKTLVQIRSKMTPLQLNMIPIPSVRLLILKQYHSLKLKCLKSLKRMKAIWKFH